jgi:hypothetical protein
LEFTAEHVVASNEIEIALQPQDAEYTGVGGKADTGVALFDAVEGPTGDAGSFGHGFGGITPPQSGDAKALTQRDELTGRRREERGSGSRHDVS